MPDSNAAGWSLRAVAVAANLQERINLRTGLASEGKVVAAERSGPAVATVKRVPSAPKPEEARHLVWLREQLGDQVAACVLFHTGPTAYTIVPGVHALPISSIWSPVSGRSIS